MKKEYYCEKVEQLKKQLQSKSKKQLQLGTYRIITFFLAVFGIIWGINERSLVGWLLGIGMTIAFIILVRHYQRLQQEIDYLKSKESVLKRYVGRLIDKGEDSWKAFEDNGIKYLKEDTKSKDLDLIGRSSLFQYLSVCETEFGKKKLAKALTKGCSSKQEIVRKQAAVKELIEDETFSLHLQTLSKQMINKQVKREEEGQLEYFIQEVEQGKSYVSKGMKLLSYGLPFITLFAIISVVFGIRTEGASIIASICIVLQMGISFMQYGSSSNILGIVYSFVTKVNIYKSFLSAIEEKQFTSPYLKELQQELKNARGAVKGLNALNGLSMAIDIRANTILYLVVASFFMWDVHCKDALEKWSKLYGKEVRKWLNVVGEFEMLLSLATLGQVKEKYCFPEIEDKLEPSIAFEKLAHPLIQEELVVPNSFSLNSDTCIITGSNMSGKTTFLRSIGTNLSLAYAGGVVVAESFNASIMTLFTSIRVEDRVDQGISTFYAELLRIKEMIEYSKQEKPMMVLIDEIFKGTNSKDRILGAKETIKRLGKPWANVMVSTHDFELCEIATNYHFEEYYKDQQICFDYKLRKGRSHSTNAQYLLKMVGILSEEG